MRATELAKLLASDVERVCKKLLPNGKRQGHEWRAGSVHGEKGDSLGVHLDGDKAGVWCDFASGDSGDLIGLWMQATGADLPTACRDAMAYLGIKEAKVENAKRKYTRPSLDGSTQLTPQHLEWLKTVRKLNPESVRAYRVGSHKGDLMFPYFHEAEVVFVKYRKIPKDFYTSSDSEPALFGWQAIPKSARRVVIVEGELDAIAMHQYGHPALSVPIGGGKGNKQGWIENEYDRLAVYDEVILALDSDKAGTEGTSEIVKRLGRERCRIATLPRKDPNECLIAGVTVEEIDKAINEARSLDPENLKCAADYEDAIWAEFRRQEGGESGISLPWGSTYDCMLRAGETSLWAGINGHGKSQVVGQIGVNAMANGKKVCIVSLEFIPPKLLRRLQIQTIGVRSPSEGQSRLCSRSWRDSMWVFDATGVNKGDTILEVFGYAARRYGVDLFIVDNLAKLGIAEDNYAGQAEFVNRLTEFSRSYGVHSILVAHVKKSDKGENSPPEKGDVKGSGGITDLVDTVFTVWRNKPKEAAIRANKGIVPAEMEQRPDCVLTCHKQRNGDKEPAYFLNFDSPTYRYFERRTKLGVSNGS